MATWRSIMDNVNETKVCRTCGKAKPIIEFYPAARLKDGYETECKVCKNIYQRARYHANAEKACRDSYGGVLRRTYGITLDDYDEMLEAQGGGCAICGKTPEENGRHLAVDHNHESGENRGLLCYACNISLGHFQDSREILASAMNYLQYWEGAKYELVAASD